MIYHLIWRQDTSIFDEVASDVVISVVAQHFLLSSQAKSLNLAEVFRMSDADAEHVFMKIRWTDNDGKPVCPHCGSISAYDCRRPNGAPRFRCKDCKGDFSITSGTLFAFHKRPLRDYLAAIAIFCNEVKGKSMLALSRDLGMSYKAAFVFGEYGMYGDNKFIVFKSFCQTAVRGFRKWLDLI